MSTPRFVKQRRGVYPTIPRLKGFPVEPRTPYNLKPPGETSADLFEQTYRAFRAGLYPVITRPELRCFLWLKQHFGENSQGRDWEYTVPALVSSSRPGGIELDFAIYAEGKLAWQVQGEHFHFSSPAEIGSDLEEHLLLEAAGYTIVNMLASMVNQDVNRVCEAGLRGEQLYEDPALGGVLPPTPEPDL